MSKPEVRFKLRLADGRWVSSHTNKTTDNPNLAGVFTAADEKSAAVRRREMERPHGPLELVPCGDKRTDAPDEPIVLTILGNERCVTTLEDLEAAAHAIHQKAVRERDVNSNPSKVVPQLITYPARPIQGGRLELAPPKRGLWYAEPKLNGWRALIHAPTGTMWNRHGKLLTIADCFRPALAKLAQQASGRLVWADCEALERRHNLGRGTLVVLDVVPESGTPTYEQRRTMLESLLPVESVFSGDTSRPVPSGAVVLTPTMRADSHADALAFYQRLCAANRTLGCDFFEGVVMKRADSTYPVQLRSETEECRGWMKHRFLT